MAETLEKILSIELEATSAINGIVRLNEAIDANNKQIALNKQAIKENNEAMKESGADTLALAEKNEELKRTNVELGVQTKELANEKRMLTKEVQNEIRANSQAEGSLKSLRAQLSNLTKQYDSLSKAERQNEQVGGALLRQINSVTTEIKTAEEETQRYFRNVGNYPETAESVKGALRSMQDEIINLTMEYRTMSDEMKNSEAGQAMKQRIEELTQKASEYKDAMSDVRQSIREGASDTRGLDTAIQAGQTLAASFGLANNAAVALGISTDGLQQAMLKMQQAMQAVQAMQVIQNALQKQSNLMRGIAIIQAKAAAAAEALNAKILAQQTGATIAQTIAQRVFNAVAKANPYILLATAILTVIGLVVGYTDSLNDNTEAQDDNAEAAQKDKEAQDELAEALRIVSNEAEARAKVERLMADDVASSVAKQLANYTYLQEKWKECGNDIQKQRAFFVNYKDAIDATGLKIHDAASATDILVKKSKVVPDLFFAMARAAAAAAAEIELLKQQILLQTTPPEFRKVGAGKHTIGSASEFAKITWKEYGALAEEQGKRGAYGSLITKIDPEKEEFTLSAEGAAFLTEFRRQESIKNNDIKIKALEVQIGLVREERKKTEAEVDELKKQVPTTGGTSSTSKGGGGNKKGSSTSNTKKDKKEEYKTEKELSDMLTAMWAKAYTERAKLAEKYTDDWRKKQIAAIKAEEHERLNEVAEAQRNYIAELDKTYKAGGMSRKAYAQNYWDIVNVTSAQIKTINRETKNEIKKLDEEIETHNKELRDKSAKDAADALKTAKEQADKQVQTMIDSFSEGSQEQMMWRLHQLEMQFAEELKMYEGNKQMEAAIERKYQAEGLKTMQEYSQKQMEIQAQKYEAFGKIAGGLSQILDEFGEESKEAAILQKSLATAEVMLAQAVAIAHAIKDAAMGSISPWQLVANIATSVTAVTVAMIQAFKSLDKAKFATGGYISGAGTGTSDSIPIRVSNGESVMNARTTAMFSGLLSSLNQLGGGVPIQATNTAQSVEGEEMLARAFARGVAMLPAPVVSVQDINEGQRQVEVMVERATL